MAYSDVILATTGLVSYWRLGELSGTSAADGKGTNTGTYQAGVTLNTAGLLRGDPDQAVTLNGTGTSVSVPDATSLHFTNQLSLECLFNPSKLDNSNQNIVARDENFLYHNTNKPGFGVKVAGTYQQILGASTWSAGRNHMLGTYDGANVRLYLDGVQVASTAVTGNVNVSTGILAMGSWIDGTSPASGVLDEVAIYNSALSAATALAHSNEAKRIYVPPLVAARGSYI